MLYRELGRTGLKVSAIGLGCAQLGSSRTEYAVELVQRAIQLGVNYIDVSRSYRDAEIKVGLALKGQRSKVVVSTKTGAKTRGGAWQHIQESLARLQTDYVDNCHLHGLYEEDDLQTRLGPGGALEALIEAKDRYGYPVGCGAHNAVGAWKQLKKQRDQQLSLACSTIVDGLPAALGADYVIYGPLSLARYLFPAISVIDTSFGQLLLEKGETLKPSHPRFRLASSIRKRPREKERPRDRGDGLDELRKAVRNYDKEAAVGAANEAIGSGVDPLTAIEAGLTPELREIGELYGRGDIWFIDLMSAALAVEAAVKVLEPEIRKRGLKQRTRGKYLIGTVAGDIHDIGKNIAGLLLMANGFEVIDLGVDVKPETFVEKVREHRPDILGMSALLTTTKKEQEKVIKALREAGLRDHVKVIIGGAATTPQWAEEIGADAYAEDALDGVSGTHFVGRI